jgi:hypothetical protein
MEIWQEGLGQVGIPFRIGSRARSEKWTALQDSRGDLQAIF